MFLKRSQGASIFHHLETSSETTKNSRDKLLEKDKLERGIALRVQEGKERKKLGKGNKNGEKKGESASVEIKRNMIPDLIGRGPFRALVDSLNTPSGLVFSSFFDSLSIVFLFYFPHSIFLKRGSYSRCHSTL